jgi:hypothetical protein
MHGKVLTLQARAPCFCKLGGFHGKVLTLPARALQSTSASRGFHGKVLTLPARAPYFCKLGVPWRPRLLGT